MRCRGPFSSRAVWLLLSVLYAVGPPARAASYTVGVEDVDQRPLSYMEDGRYSGFARDLLDAFAASRGDRFVYVALPIKRLYQSFLQERSLDFKFPDNPQWREAERLGAPVVYSAAVLEVTAGLMVLAEHRGRPVGRVNRLGTLRGYSPWPYKAQIDAGAMVLTDNSSMENLIRQLERDRLDAIYVNIEFARVLLNRLDLEKRIVYDRSLPHVNISFQLSTLNRSEMIQALNAFLKRETSLQAALRHKYGLSSEAR